MVRRKVEYIFIGFVVVIYVVRSLAIKNCFHRDLVAIPSAPSQNLNWQAASDLCQAHKMSLASSPYDGAKVPFKQTLYWQCSTQFIREQQDYSRFDLRVWSNSCKTDGACGAFVIDRDLKVYDNFLNATRDTTANSRFALCQRSECVSLFYNILFGRRGG